MTVDDANRVLAEADLLASMETVDRAISRMATDITLRLSNSRPVFLCVMNGGLIFAGQLLSRLIFPLEIDYVHVTRYGHATSGGVITWLARPQINLYGRSVVLLDDILDEGATIASIADYCRQQGASEVLMAVMVDKRHDRKITVGFKADFTGLEIEDRFLFGCGLDYQGYWRNAPGIYAVKRG